LAPAADRSLHLLENAIRFDRRQTAISACLHCNSNIASCLDFIDRLWPFRSADRRAEIISWGKANPPLVDENAMIAQVIIDVVNQDVERVCGVIPAR
jgi:hypothetical protein